VKSLIERESSKRLGSKWRSHQNGGLVLGMRNKNCRRGEKEISRVKGRFDYRNGIRNYPGENGIGLLLYHKGEGGQKEEMGLNS